MAHHTTTLTVATHGQALYEITDDVTRWLSGLDVTTGLVTIFCRHTSASLLINENAAPAVQRDLLRWLRMVVPEGAGYEHDSEGPDDMPAHIRTMLTGAHLAIPVADGRMMLGTWQGIYLAEHRAAPHTRSVALHISGE